MDQELGSYVLVQGLPQSCRKTAAGLWSSEAWLALENLLPTWQIPPPPCQMVMTGQLEKGKQSVRTFRKLGLGKGQITVMRCAKALGTEGSGEGFFPSL